MDPDKILDELRGHEQWANRTATEIQTRMATLEATQTQYVTVREISELQRTIAVTNQTLLDLVQRMRNIATNDDIQRVIGQVDAVSKDLTRQIDSIDRTLLNFVTLTEFDKEVKEAKDMAADAKSLAWKLFYFGMAVITAVGSALGFWIGFVHK